MGKGKGAGIVGLLWVVCPILAGTPSVAAEDVQDGADRGPGLLTGQVFTANHPDSVMEHAVVELIFRKDGGEIEGIEAAADHSGRFAFAGLDTSHDLAYVLRVRSAGKDFLSEPILFAAGEETLVYNVVASTEMPIAEGALPEGHPAIEPAQGRRPPERPFLAALILLWLALCFLFLFRQSRERGRDVASRFPPAARGLVRDIASLDMRFERGEIGEDEYKKIRVSLRGRLIEIVEAHPPVE